MFTSASPGGRFIASIAISTCRSSSQALWASILSCTVACSAEQLFHFGRIGDLAEAGVDFVEAVEDGADVVDGFFDVAEDVFVGIELRFLREIADGDSRR